MPVPALSACSRSTSESIPHSPVHCRALRRPQVPPATHRPGPDAARQPRHAGRQHCERPCACQCGHVPACQCVEGCMHACVCRCVTLDTAGVRAQSCAAPQLSLSPPHSCPLLVTGGYHFKRPAHACPLVWSVAHHLGVSKGTSMRYGIQPIPHQRIHSWLTDCAAPACVTVVTSRCCFQRSTACLPLLPARCRCKLNHRCACMVACACVARIVMLKPGDGGCDSDPPMTHAQGQAW